MGQASRPARDLQIPPAAPPKAGGPPEKEKSPDMTDAQLAANRANARKSTGPRTDAGKSASRMNALKSGIHAQSHIIRGEDPEALASLAAEYNTEFHPVTPRQRDLVDVLVHNEWKIRRLRAIEADLWDERFDDVAAWPAPPDSKAYFRRRNHLLSCAFNDELEKRLENLQRRLHAYERSTTRALKELHQLQASETEPSDPIGFVPSITQTSASEDRANRSFELDSSVAPNPGPRPLIPAQRSEALARPISGHLPVRAIPVTDCTETAYPLAAEVPEQPIR